MRALVVLMSALLVVPFFAAATRPSRAPRPADTAGRGLPPQVGARVDAFAHDALRASGASGVAIVVVRGGHVTNERAYGIDRDGRAMTVRTPVAVDAATHLFAAVATLRLIEQGRVHLDMLPSGIVGETVRGVIVFEPRTPVRRSAAAASRSPSLVRLVEVASDTPFERFVHEAVFVPFGLGDTTVAAVASNVGAVRTTAHDAGTFLETLLSRGVAPSGRRVFAAAVRRLWPLGEREVEAPAPDRPSSVVIVLDPVARSGVVVLATRPHPFVRATARRAFEALFGGA